MDSKPPPQQPCPALPSHTQFVSDLWFLRPREKRRKRAVKSLVKLRGERRRKRATDSPPNWRSEYARYRQFPPSEKKKLDKVEEKK